MIFTVFCGAMPVLMRLFIASGEEGLPLVSLSDFAFFGIMLNTGMIWSLGSNKWVGRESFSVFLGMSSLLIMILVAIFALSIKPNAALIPWIAVSIIILLSLGLSYLATHDRFLYALQDALTFADLVAEQHPLMQKFVREQLQSVVHGPRTTDDPDLCEEWRRFLAERGLTTDAPAKTSEENRG